MIKVSCRSNLDLDNEVWPTELPCRPVVGDYIESLKLHNKGPHHTVRLRLRVCSVTFEPDIDDSYKVCVELHLPSHFENIASFYEWYERLTGRTFL